MIEHLLEPLVAERFKNEEKYRTGHIRITNALPGRAIMGVHIPEMKKLAGEMVRGENAAGLISGFEKEAGKGRTALTHEEMMVWGMMINGFRPERHGCGSDAKVRMLMNFVPHIDNWAVCDTFTSGAKWLGKLEGGWDVLCRYFASDKDFEVRFATVAAMCHFLDRKFLPRIFFRFDSLDFSRISSEYAGPSEVKAAGGADAVLESGRGVAVGESPYYVRMGVAWCLATALAKFPDDTRGYLRHSRLPDDVLKLYARKARESFRTRDISPF